MPFLPAWARKPLTWVIVAVAMVGMGVVGLAVFQPWKLVVDELVDEAAPAVASGLPAPGASRAPAAGPQVLASGEFISHEHETTGRVSILGLPDGRRVLRLEELNTSNGPDLRVWITDAEVKTGASGWGVFDDGRYAEVGRLKGNKGSQNYDLPASVKLTDYRSVTIWCDRFNVSFGAATLAIR